MSDDLMLWAASALVILGALLMTAGVYGIAWMPDVYVRVHAASKAVFLGAFPVLVAAMLVGDVVMLSRAALIALLLLVTSTVSAHAVGRAAYLAGEDMEAPGSIDESRDERLAGRK